MSRLSLGRFLAGSLFFLVFCSSSAVVRPQTPAATPLPAPSGKTPIIIIPGLTGSNLVNSRTGEEVWFKPRRSHDDDLRLPISPNLARNRDALVAKDIIRKVQFIKILPDIEIYERLTDALEKRGGYREGNWKTPPKDGFRDTFYTFAYDWRRDNVENARLLIRQIEQLKRTLKKPDLKFNVIAHSMGGLIARYAAMYGNSDIPAGAPKPTWSGARHFDKIFLLGTPNEGSTSALSAMLEGFSYVGGGLNLPFIQNINRFDVFTIPSMFQLLPHEGTLLAYDENLKPIAVDLFDPKTWENYGWSLWRDDGFTKRMSPLEQKNARPYFAAVLSRAKRFQAALDAGSGQKPPVSFYLMGANCKETQNAILLIRDAKKNTWKTIFKPTSFTRSNGDKVSEEQVKPLLMSMGDGVVTRRSLAGENAAGDGKVIDLSPVGELFQCESHNKLFTNPEIQEKLFLLLSPPPGTN